MACRYEERVLSVLIRLNGLKAIGQMTCCYICPYKKRLNECYEIRGGENPEQGAEETGGGN